MLQQHRGREHGEAFDQSVSNVDESAGRHSLAAENERGEGETIRARADDEKRETRSAKVILFFFPSFAASSTKKLINLSIKF